MIQVNVTGATEDQLNWLVAQCQGLEFDENNVPIWFPEGSDYLAAKRIPYQPTKDDCLMGAICDSELIGTMPCRDSNEWEAMTLGEYDEREGIQPEHVQRGSTRRIAAARCYIASKRGEVVEVPEALRAAGRLLEAAGVSDHDQPTALSEGGVIADLPAGDIQHLVQAFRKGGMVIEQDIPEITKTPFRAQVRGEFVPFGKRDALAVEQVTGEPLCVVPHVVPFALPLSLASSKIADAHWKSAVQDGNTQLGFEEWRRQYLLEHTVSKIIMFFEQRQAEQAKGKSGGRTGGTR